MWHGKKHRANVAHATIALCRYYIQHEKPLMLLLSPHQKGKKIMNKTDHVKTWIFGETGTAIFLQNNVYSKVSRRKHTPEICSGREIDLQLDICREPICLTYIPPLPVLLEQLRQLYAKYTSLVFFLNGMDKTLGEKLQRECIGHVDKLFANDDVYQFVCHRVLYHKTTKEADLENAIIYSNTSKTRELYMRIMNNTESKTLLFGEVGQAFYCDNNQWFKISVRDETPLQCNPRDMNILYDVCYDSPVIYDHLIPPKKLSKMLFDLYEKHTALEFFLDGLNTEYDNQLRINCIRNVEETCRENPDVYSFLESRVLNKPKLPDFCGKDFAIASSVSDDIRKLYTQIN